ncbi:unnamed protein product, partial [Meganyctiphanes norvegica]
MSFLRRLVRKLNGFQGSIVNDTYDLFECLSCAQESIDPQQYALLEEPCILVDENDTNIGRASKKSCHLMQNGTSLLHRAFSVFLFNTQEELLLHRRSDAKITFPGHYTNTCCSHPLYTSEETVEKDALGVRVAAQRRLQIELGIPPEQVKPENMTYLTRIHYASPSNGMWGEHEMDYIIFIKSDVQLSPNENEVMYTIFIEREHFQSEFLCGLLHGKVSREIPWVQLISFKFAP